MNLNSENLIKEMAEAGLHFGHSRTYTHPKATQFLVKGNNPISIIDLEQTKKYLEEALNAIIEIVKNKGLILFVGTTPGAKNLVKNLAQKYNYPYVDERWLGGTLTNFKTLSLRIKTLEQLEEDEKSGKWNEYTKKERVHLYKELDSLQKKFAGLRKLDKLPDLLVVIDTGVHKIAVREANKLNIPIVGILDNDDDPSFITYPIPANDSAKSSIAFLIGKIEEALIEGQKSQLVKEIISE
ncbi:MAG: 30S ribosomal protein S2 [Minisyncoccia bacterium]|jgi:small subunit ribosomal protein S2